MKYIFYIFLAIIFSACNKDTLPQPHTYQATMHYHSEAWGEVKDSIYQATISTQEQNDTLILTYYLYDGQQRDQRFTEKTAYSADSVVYYFNYPYPHGKVIVHPVTNKLSFEMVYDSRSAGDQFWYSYEGHSN